MHITTLECALMIEAWEHRWDELKTYLEEYKKFERDDYGRGWNHAMNVALEKMKALEEK
jgi:hypothetical protein